MQNYFLAKDRMQQMQTQADLDGQVKEAKQSRSEVARPWFSLKRWFKRNPRPLKVNPEYRAALILQEWEIKSEIEANRP